MFFFNMYNTCIFILLKIGGISMTDREVIHLVGYLSLATNFQEYIFEIFILFIFAELEALVTALTN